MLRFAPAFKGRYIASTRGGVTENIARISVSMLAACAGTVAHEGSATISTSIGVSASGQQTDQQHYGTAAVGVVISSAASASVTSTHSGTATASIVITTTAAGETGATHAGTASIGVTISATASGTTSQTHAGAASCQINLSVSASGLLFDPLTQVLDESGNGNTMTLVSSPSSSTTPSFSTDAAIGSRSVDFDKSSDHGATVPSTYEDVLDSPFTFSAWLKPNDGQTTQTSYIFHSSGEFKRASGTSEWTFQVFTHQSGDIVAGIQYWNGTSSLLRRRQTLNPAFSDGAQSSWTHLAVTVDSTCTPIIYINGSSVTVANNGNDTLSLSNFFSVDSFASIGSYGSVNGLGQYVPAFEYDGKLDDISIWSTALTSTQISNLYNSGNGTDLTGSSNLAAWWKMGDGNAITHSGTASCQVNLSVSAAGFNTSTTVPDETSNGNNMTLYADGSGTKYAYSSDAAIGTRSVEFEGSATTDGTGGYGIIDNTFQSVFRSSFSISAWVKLDDGDVNYNWILGNYPSGGASGSNYVALYFMGGDPRFTYRAGSVGKLVWDQDYDLANGQSGWIHLVGTYNATDDSMYLYVNGTEAASNTTSTDPTQYTNSVNLRVNKYEDSNANYIYTGKKIDDISIWSKALSSTEVSNMYNSGSGTSLTGSSDLEGWWKMGDHSVLPVTHSGIATVSVAVTASADGDLLELHSGTASIGVTILSTASGITTQTHSGTASCQVNLSASASGSSVTPTAYSNNYSIDLDGTNQYLSVSDHNDFSFGNSTTDSAFSVAAWIKMDDATKFRIFSKQTNSSNIEYVFGVDGLDRLGVNLYDGATSNYRGVYSSSIQSHEGSWIHVAMTYDGTGGSTAYNGMKLYLNGSALSTSSNSGGGYTAMHNTTTDVWIGGANFVPDYANGKIDEVAVFSSELTSTQISNIYNNGAPTNLSSESNLVGYWRMEENTGTTVADSSGNGHTATLNNSPTFSTDVPVYSNNYSIALDGSNDYAPIVGSLSAGTYDFLTSTLTYSASLWFKFDDHTQNSSQVLLANNYTNSNKGIQIWYDNRSGHATKALRVNSWAGSSVSTNTASAITDNNWHHVLVTSSGASGTLTVYLDGSSLTTASLGSVTSTAPNQDLAIGGRVISGSVNSPIDGKLDEVAIWDVALSSADVTAIYNSGSPNNLKVSGSYDTNRSGDLQGYWRFEENTGTSIADTSGNGNTATLSNGPTFSTNVPSSSSSGFTISTFDTETNILASTPSNGTVAYGTDTESYYVYDSSLGWAEFTPT